MNQLTIQQALDLALQHHQAGRLREAEQLYRQILALQPEHVEALHNLGLIAHQVGRIEAAMELYRRVISLRPDCAEAYSNLGKVLTDEGDIEGAIAACRQAILIRPDYASGYHSLGNALRANGKPDESIPLYQRAIALKPGYAEAYCNLGSALLGARRLDDAIAAYRQAISLNPNLWEAYSNLGNALTERGQFDQATDACRRAIAGSPRAPAPYNNLGNALQGKGQLDDAIAAYRQAVSLGPDLCDAYANLGHALKERGQPDEAIAACRAAIAINPRFAAAHNNLGIALREIGQLDEAIAAFRHAVSFDPGDARLDSNLVYTLQFHPAFDAKAIAKEHRRWNESHAAGLGLPNSGSPRESPPCDSICPGAPRHCNDRNPDRRLCIGYVSADFREHSLGRYLMPLFQHHDHRILEITCYANVRRPDAMTAQFQRFSGRWRSIVGLSDYEVARQVREDKIDILVDPNLHMADNRLLAFARKPAAVQATFAGYPGSTGMTAVDYRISDPYLDPPGMDESVYSEQTVRLPDSFWCYDPLDCREIAVDSLPALSAGHVTFGCLNNFCKVNDGVLFLWAQVLRKVVNSRLLLLAPYGSHRTWATQLLQHEGIDPARVEFVPFQPRREYMELYHRIDLGLDSFPYNGHTTSLDSFWMGVPVVTLVGARAVSRAGWCQLSNLGLTELAGHTPEQFVRIAVELANDLPRLKELRSTLRGRMEQSPLMDAPEFARNIEAAYRQMWRRWCESVSAGS